MQNCNRASKRVTVMTIISKLECVMAARGVGTTELARKVGITSTNLSRFKKGKVKCVRFTTLNALCRELKCQPMDLLSYLPDED